MNDEHGQGDLFVQREKRSRVGRPRPRGSAAMRPGGAEHAPRQTPEDPDRARLRATLERIALESGLLFADGFMLADVRREAQAAGLLTGEEGRPDPATGRMTNPRALAWLGDLLPAMARRGLVRKLTISGRVQFGGSDGQRAHGNKNVLWVLTQAGCEAARRIAAR